VGLDNLLLDLFRLAFFNAGLVSLSNFLMMG